MTKRHIINIIIPITAAVLSIILAISLHFGVPKYPVPSKTVLADATGREINGVCISDLEEINYLKYAYYTPNEFLDTPYDTITGTEVDITKQKNIAKRGTYQFVFYNLNPEDESFINKKQALEPYLQSDLRWHFMLYLPPCFSASYVYVRGILASTAGEIKDYDFIEYSDQQGYSETHRDGTAPAALDVSFYSRMEALSNDFRIRSLIITVHYESESIKAGFDGIPIMGAENAVKSAIGADRTLLSVVAISAAFVFAILTFACILKKSLFAVPQAALTFGITGFIFFKQLMYTNNSAPILCWVCEPLCAVVIIAAAALSLFYAIKQRKTEFLIAPPIAIDFGLCYLILPFSAPVFPSPVVWLSVLILCFTTFSAFAFFANLEKRNVYLTNNLKSEVARQTEDLKAIVSERDKLLRYLSHDMKKPVMGIKHFVDEIRKNETNSENVKALDIIDEKLDGLQAGFVELQKFAKMNFAAEQSETLYTDEILNAVFQRLSPDCEANGISLKVSSPKITVFAKRGILNSVLDNLIFNAVEHSKCSNIIVAATKSSGTCKITVTDDGMGIESGRDVFLPYYSENGVADNLGLGLYICRQHMLSMGGELTYTRENGKTIFTITLNLA